MRRRRGLRNDTRVRARWRIMVTFHICAACRLWRNETSSRRVCCRGELTRVAEFSFFHRKNGEMADCVETTLVATVAANLSWKNVRHFLVSFMYYLYLKMKRRMRTHSTTVSRWKVEQISTVYSCWNSSLNLTETQLASASRHQRIQSGGGESSLLVGFRRNRDP